VFVDAGAVITMFVSVLVVGAYTLTANVDEIAPLLAVIVTLDC
jgi:hypothetical protein